MSSKVTFNQIAQLKKRLAEKDETIRQARAVLEAFEPLWERIKAVCIGDSTTGPHTDCVFVQASEVAQLLTAFPTPPHTLSLERTTDLLRYQRHELFTAGLIDETEYAALCQVEGSVARLEGYDIAKANLKKTISTLTAGLEESVKLQSHYAKLLNEYDGGERKPFASATEWLARLAEVQSAKKPS